MAEKIAGSLNRPVQRSRVRKGGWTQEKRKIFLDALAATCNVSMALEAAGGQAPSLYRLRARDAAFAELWREALAIGYERLEMAVLSRVLEGVNAIEIDIAGDVLLPGEGPAPASKPVAAAAGKSLPETVKAALMLLDRHRASVEGVRAPMRGRRATAEETNALLCRKLDMLARKLRANAAPEDGGA